jgi:hypothetical protein
MRKPWLALSLVTLTALLVGCQGAAPKFAQEQGMYLLSREALDQLGLENVWSAKVGLEGSLRDAYLLSEVIVMETDALKLKGVDRKTGTPAWQIELQHPTDYRGCEDQEYIYVPCHDVLVAIDKRGFVAWRNFLKFAPAGIPAADAMHIYLGCWDHAVHSFLKDKGYFDYKWTTGGPIEAEPAVTNRYVYAGSADGWLYALTTEKLDCDWKFKTNGPIQAGVVTDNRQVFCASTDGDLYCLVDVAQESRQQQMAWLQPYASGGSIFLKPYLTKDLVFIVNENKECHAVRRDSGVAVWTVKNVDKVLTQGKLSTFLLRAGAVVVAVDTKTGEVRWQLDTRPGNFVAYLTNTMDSCIYMVKRTGETQVIREKGSAAPVEAAPEKKEGDVKPEPKKPADKKAEPAAEKKTEGAAEEKKAE